MKNKEIEELLNNFQEVLDNPTTTDECYDGRIIEIDRSYDLEQDEIKLLLSYMEQLEEENDRLKEVVKNLTTMTVNGDTKQIKNTAQYKLEQLENNRDKAIKYINEMSGYDVEDYIRQDLLLLLKGDSDDK